MARVDKTGIHPTTLQQYVERFGERFHGEFGEELSLDPETVQGQWIGLMSLSLSEADENLVDSSQAMSLDAAEGTQLDDLGSPLDIIRLPGRQSRVTATLRGDVGVGIPTGSRARTAPAGAEFASTGDAVLAGANVDVSVVFEADEEGPVVAAAGELTEIITPVPGWLSITNVNAAAVGVAEESDDEYRSRFATRSAHRAFGSKDALRASIEAAGATSVLVEENDTSIYKVVQGFTLAPHSFIAVVEGGADSDIAAAIVKITGQEGDSRKGLGAGALTGITGAAVTDPTDILGSATSRNPYDFNYAGQVLTLDVGSDPEDVAGGVWAGYLQPVLRASSDAMVASSSVIFHQDGYFVILFPWFEGFAPTFRETEAGNDRRYLPELLNLDDSNLTVSPGPFVRTAESDLSVTIAVTIDRLFPSNGLATIRSNLLELVEGYEIAQAPWENDFLVAAESVRGARVTSLTVEEGTTDIASIVVPLNRRWKLTTGNLTINLTR